jgi:hypothetical protein
MAKYVRFKRSLSWRVLFLHVVIQPSLCLAKTTGVSAWPQTLPVVEQATPKLIILIQNAGRGNNGNGQGNGNGGGQGNQGNGNQGKGNGNQGQGNQGNGNGNQGNGNQGNGNGNQGNINQASGNQGNGNGEPQDSGKGKGKGQKVGQTQAAVTTPPALQQLTALIDRDLESRFNGSRAAAIGAASLYNTGSNLGVFAVSGISYTAHDGFKTTSQGAHSTGPAFDILNTGVTAGVRYDVSQAMGLAQKSVIVGAFGNYTRSDISITAPLADTGLSPGDGKTAVDSLAGGAYAVVTAGRLYMLGIGAYSTGTPNFFNNQASTTQNTTGFVSSGAVGTVLPLAGRFNADLRATLSYSSSSLDSSVGTGGVFISQGKVEDLTGSLSVKVFYMERWGAWTVRPFAQAGVAEHLTYTNQVAVDNILYKFTEDPTSFTGRVGFDFEHDELLQSFLALKGDVSSDRTTVSGQVGLTLKLN